MSVVGRATFVWLTCLVLARAAGAFSLLPDLPGTDVEANLGAATRWSSIADQRTGAGLHDRVQVAVQSDFAEKLGQTDAADIDRVRLVISDAFRAWENDLLRFDVDFTRQAVEGRGAGAEIDLFAVPNSHSALGGGSYFGYTYYSSRRLTLPDGTVTDQDVITSADIFISIDNVTTLAQLLPRERQPDALQRLIMHELGHALGFGHPNVTEANTNYDTDMDPENPMIIDPAHPYDDLIISPNRDNQAIMSNDRARLGSGIYYTSLQNDERGGRDTLYATFEICACDCNDDNEVDIAELVSAVLIAQGEIPTEGCAKADVNRDQMVSIDELIRGVGKALSGCLVAPATAGIPRLWRGTAPTRETEIGCYPAP